jgi:hypothetical protein
MTQNNTFIDVLQIYLLQGKGCVILLEILVKVMHHKIPNPSKETRNNKKIKIINK